MDGGDGLVGYDGIICGLRLSFVEHRAVIGPSPTYHMCSFHGVETDLLNLTSCVGYELWRVSTTCTLVLESVKATSVIFLLGVGSYVCYKLYHQYKRRSRRPPPDFKPSAITSWVSRELLDSCLSHNGEDESSVKNRKRETVYHRRMGAVHSSKQQHLYYEPVVYNVHSGVNLLGNAGSGGGTALYSTPCIQSTFRKCRLRGDCTKPQRTGHDDDHERIEEASHPKVPRPRPTTLQLRVSRPAADGTDVDHRFPLLDDLSSGGGLYDDGDVSDSGESLRDVDSLASSEGVEGGDDEEDDDRFLRSGFRCDGDDDLLSRSGSMKGNFSPGSLLNRRLIMSPVADDRLPPEGKDSTPGGDRRRFLVPYSTCSPIADDDPLSNLSSVDELRDVFDLSAAGGPSPGGHGGSVRRQRLVRDLSFNSDLSDLSMDADLSVDAAAFENVGRSTEAAIHRLQMEIDSVKRDCEELETCMGHVDGHGPTPLAYTALVCPHALSDISECSDAAPAGEDELSFRRGELGCARRAAMLREHGEGSTARKRSRESSVDHSTTTSSSSFVMNSANASLEWDSMRGGDKTGEVDASLSEPRGVDGRTRSQCPKKSTPNTNGAAPGVDSGSDFGTPLTNGSPEPYANSGGRLRSESIVSLEWEEEFNRSSTAVFEDHDAVFAPPQCRSCRSSDVVSAAEELDTLPTPVSPDSNRGRICGRAKTVPASSLIGRRRSIGGGTTTTTERGGTMWSSIESGYIDEFSCESGGNSKQITPHSTDDTSSSFSRGRRRLLHLPLPDRHPGERTGVAMTNSTCPQVRDPIVDSAYFEGNELLEDVRTWPVIGEKQRADTSLMAAEGVSKDFVTACHQLEVKHIRAIHSDDYSALRAVLVQTLALGYSPFEQSGGLDTVKKKISLWVRCHHGWLTKWNFARKLNYDEKSCLQGMLDCLQSLDWLTSCVLSSTNKDACATNMLNSDPELDVQAMEAVKLMMIMSLVELREAIAVDMSVPVFSLLLFSRESSKSPEAYLENHLNHLGANRVLDKMDFFLLGYSFGMTICLLHPMSTENEDLVSYFPDYNLGSWPQIYLVLNQSRQQDRNDQYSVILR